MADRHRNEIAEPDSDRPLVVDRAMTFFWAAMLVELFRAMVVFDYSQANAMVPAVKASFELALSCGINAWFIYKIAGRRNWARLVTLALNVVCLIPFIVFVMQTMATSRTSAVAYVIEAGLNAIGIALLFARPARAWFSGR